MDRTKKRQRQRAVIACMLLLTLMPFFLVKAFHVHGEHSCVSHNDRDTPVTILLKIVPSVSLRSPRLSRQGFYIRLYSDWQACKVLISGETDVIVILFPHFLRAPSVCLSYSHAITVIACRGFSCPVLTDYNPFIFFQV